MCRGKVLLHMSDTVWLDRCQVRVRQPTLAKFVCTFVLVDDKDFFDVTIACDDEQLQALHNGWVANQSVYLAMYLIMRPGSCAMVDETSEGETAMGNSSDTVGSGPAVWGQEGGSVTEIPKGEETICVVPEIFKAPTVGVEIHHIDTDIKVYDVQWGGRESGNIDDVENPPVNEEKEPIGEAVGGREEDHEDSLNSEGPVLVVEGTDEAVMTVRSVTLNQ